MPVDQGAEVNNSVSPLRSMLRSTGVYSIAVLIGKMASFFLLPVYTHFLTPADYGVVELMELTLFVFSTLIGMRLGDGLMYYYARANTPEDRAQVVASSIAGAVLLGCVGAVIGYLIAPSASKLVFSNDQYVFFFRLMFFSFSLSLPVEVVFCYIRAVDRPMAYLTGSVTQLVLAATLNIFTLAVLHWGIRGVLWSKLIVAAIMLVGMLAYAISKIRFVSSMRVVYSLLKYSAPLGLGGFGFLIIHYGDRYFLQHFVSLSEIGIYSLAYKLGMLVSYCLMPFEIYWSAQKFRLVRGAEGEKLFVRVFTYEVLALGFVVVALTLFADPVIHFMAAPAFAPAAQYVPWIALAYWIRTIGSYFRNVFMLEAKTRLDAIIVWLSAAACLAGYTLLIPRYHLWGAVIATGGAFVIMAIASFIIAERVRPYHYEYLRFGQIALAMAAPVVLYRFVRPEAVWLQIVWAAVLLLVFPAILWMTGFLASDEKKLLRAHVPGLAPPARA